MTSLSPAMNMQRGNRYKGSLGKVCFVKMRCQERWLGVTHTHTHRLTDTVCVHAQRQITCVHKHSQPHVDYLTAQIDKHCVAHHSQN